MTKQAYDTRRPLPEKNDIVSDERSREIEERVLDFVQQKWGKAIGRSGEIRRSDNLFREGIIDSIGVLALVGFLEQEFELEIEPEELVLENFESVSSMSTLVARLETGRL